MPQKPLEAELKQILRTEFFAPDQARAAYQRLLEAYPEDDDVAVQYAWFLTDQGDPSGVDLASRVLLRSPTCAPALFVLAFGNATFGAYDASIEGFGRLFATVPPPHLPDGPYMYFSFLVMRLSGFVPQRARLYLDGFFAKHPELEANGTRALIVEMFKSRVRQVFVQDERVSGFLLFVDLVSSTQYKRDFPDLWADRIVHFLMYTKYAFRTLSFDFIKFIGDEVMLFVPFTEGVDKADLAHEIFRFIFSKHGWYLEEVNRFNPALAGAADPANSPHRIKVKLTLGEVENAKLFHPYYNEHYDFIGKDVDRIARIKEMGHEDLVIVDEGFYRALAANGPAFAEAMSDLRWRQKFKGIDEEVRFYGRPLK